MVEITQVEQSTVIGLSLLKAFKLELKEINIVHQGICFRVKNW